VTVIANPRLLLAGLMASGPPAVTAGGALWRGRGFGGAFHKRAS
jgi:hypothetical protein